MCVQLMFSTAIAATVSSATAGHAPQARTQHRRAAVPAYALLTVATATKHSSCSNN
jgi:hypothetical protein